MKHPRTPGTGITGAQIAGGDAAHLIEAGSTTQRRKLASWLDREADHLLHIGRHAAAERLAWRAAEIRAGGAA